MFEIPIERHRLNNGLRLIMSPDHTMPTVAVDLWYDVGSRHEAPGRNGFAHLFEHLMFQGSEHVARGEHAALIERAGGTHRAETRVDGTHYLEALPSHELELALWLESDRMAGLLPVMTQGKLDDQRDLVKHERRWVIDDKPYGTWDERMAAGIFPEGHGYSHPVIGSTDDLDAAGLDDIRDFFATYYVPNNAVLTIAGDFEPADALAMVERHFGHIPANPDLPTSPAMAIEPLIGHEVRKVVHDRVPLPRVYLAYRMPAFGSDAFDDMAVAGDLLSVGRASRLQRSLVRGRWLAIDIKASPVPMVGGAAMFAVSATAVPGVEPQQLETALIDEIDKLTSEGPSDTELARVRNLYAFQVESDLERIAENAHRLSMYAALFDAPERINMSVKRYLAVDAERVRSTMVKTMRADNRLVLTYLPVDAAANIGVAN